MNLDIPNLPIPSPTCIHFDCIHPFDRTSDLEEQVEERNDGLDPEQHCLSLNETKDFGLPHIVTRLQGLPVVYILKLQHGKFYIGFTENIGLRLLQHLQGKGAIWTTLYRVESLLHLYLHVSQVEEWRLTLEWIKRYGREHVRGAGFCRIVPPSLDVLNKAMGRWSRNIDRNCNMLEVCDKDREELFGTCQLLLYPCFHVLDVFREILFRSYTDWQEGEGEVSKFVYREGLRVLFHYLLQNRKEASVRVQQFLVTYGYRPDVAIAVRHKFKQHFCSETALIILSYCFPYPLCDVCPHDQWNVVSEYQGQRFLTILDAAQHTGISP